jgi:PAS domain S-box-containing protein
MMEHDSLANAGDGAQAVFTLDALPVPCVLCLDWNRQVFQANKAMIALLGEKEDWKPEWWTDSLDPESREAVVSVVSDESDAPKGAVIKLRRSDGDVVDVEMRASRTPRGLLLCFLRSETKPEPVLAGSASDSAEGCVLTDLLPIGIVGICSCKNGKITLCNRSMELMFGIKRAEVVGHNYMAAFASDAMAPLRKLVATVCADGKGRGLDYLPFNGSGGIRRILDVRVELVNGNCTAECGLLMSVLDATDRYREKQETA